MSLNKFFNKAIVTSAIVGLAIVPTVVNMNSTYASYNSEEATKQVEEGRLLLTQTTYNDSPIYKVKINPQYLEDVEVIHIPSTVNGIPIKVIEEEAFRNSKASAIYFENSDSIMEVGQAAFENTIAGNAISFTGIKEVQRSTFKNSNFSEINLDGDKIQSIYSSAFAKSKATNVMSLPNITKIPEAAFDESLFKDIVLTENIITEIGPSAFRYVQIKKDVSFPNISRVEASTFSWTAFTNIYLDGSKIQSIGSEAFAMSLAENIMSLPNITEVPAGAFNNTMFKEINLNWPSITSIGKDSFRNTKETRPISMPLLTIIPDGAFAHSVFTEINLSYDKITSIGSDSFLNTKDTQSISLPLITKVPGAAFKWSDFSEIHLSPELVTSISTEAFYSTLATNRLELTNVTRISDRAFAKTKFSFINFTPSKVEKYGSEAFTLPEANISIDSDNIISVSGMQIPHESIVLIKGHGLQNPETLINTGYVVQEGKPVDQSYRGPVTALMKYPDGTIQNLGEINVTHKNRPPSILTNLQDITLGIGESSSVVVDVQDLDESDIVTVTAESSVPDSVEVSVLDTSINIKANAQGLSTITVTATDTAGETSKQRFNVEVKGSLDNSESSQLEVLAGELTLKHNKVNTPHLVIDMDSKKKTYEYSLQDELIVQDARGTNSGWELNVTSSELTNGNNKIPSGSLLITSPTIENKTGNNSGIDGINKLPTESGVPIDTGSAVSVGRALKGHGGGSFKFTFENGLKVVINPSEIFLDSESDTYTATLTWSLVSGPTQ